MPTGVVTFNQQEWAAAYPELAACVPNAQGYFDRATLYLSNTPTSRVQNVDTRKTLLYLLTAHIAALFAPNLPQAQSGVVGRISSASQGSVSVATDYPSSPSGAWYNQTQWGAAYWQATRRFRSARYVAGLQPVFPPVIPPFGADPYRVS